MKKLYMNLCVLVTRNVRYFLPFDYYFMSIFRVFVLIFHEFVLICYGVCSFGFIS